MMDFYRYLPFFYLAFIVACSDSSPTVPPSALDLDNGSVETCYDVQITYGGTSQPIKNICTTRENNIYNGLGVNRFIKLSLSSNSTVSIRVTRTSGLDPADPDIYVYRNGLEIHKALSAQFNRETMTEDMLAGEYVILLNDYVYTNRNSNNKSGQAALLNQKTLQKTSSASVRTKTVSTCDSTNELSVSGVVEFERVYHVNNSVALDYSNINNIPPLPIQMALVEVICNNGVYSSAISDTNGSYNLAFPFAQQSFIRVNAQMLEAGTPSWDFSVVDNTTSGKPVYAMDSSPFNETTNQSNKDLLATSGWTGNSYGNPRVAAPFAILDTVRKAKAKILNASTVALNFPALKINWSVKNTTSSGSLTTGAIESSFFDDRDNEIYLLGAENNDTDEYDEHVILHEWGHYFEAVFSRSDSIGGVHTGGDILDIRVVFGEGFGNALSAMIMDDPLYIDTQGFKQQNGGFFINMENNSCTNPGWYSECSIQSVLYDIYDSSDENPDTIRLGFTPIYNVLTGVQKNTPALTSIFSFIKPLKDQNPSAVSAIDSLTSAQNIDPVQDIYGGSQLNNNPGVTNQLPIYEPF